MTNVMHIGYNVDMVGCTLTKTSDVFLSTQVLFGIFNLYGGKLVISLVSVVFLFNLCTVFFIVCWGAPYIYIYIYIYTP